MSLLNYVDLSSWDTARDSALKLWLFERVRPNTLASRARLNTLVRLARDIDRRHVPGVVVECGVFKGGSAAVMARNTPDRPLVLFDSFEGLPPPGENDGAAARERYRSGWCASSENDVIRLFDRLGIDRARVRLVPGWFHETFPATPIDTIALLHIDADWYDSVKLCLNHFYDRVAPGGFVALDDYGRWEGCTRAADEFLQARGLAGVLSPRSPEGHFFQKPAEPS